MRFLILAVPLLLAGCLADEKRVDEVTHVTDNLSLQADVTKTKFILSTPNVEVDGNGFTIDGQCNTDCVGLVIAADNIVVRNLTIEGFDGGVSIINGASGVRFENVTITDNIQHGIFVDTGASNFTCDRCTISDNGAMGIYFEYNTHGSIVKDSEVSYNGFRDKDTGDWVQNQKNKKKDKREGIAIDASQGNLIEDTDFFGNALAGVTLYRNCGERGIRREWGANHNTIRGGEFHDDILVAARQDRDLSKWDCLDPYVHEGKYIMDEAEFNVIENLELVGNTRIVIQDDNNTVSNITGGELVASSRVRDALQQPLTGLDFNAITSNYTGDPAFVLQ